MSTALKYSKSLRSYNPIPRGCVLYLPLWNPNLSGGVFKSIDPFGHTCTVTNTTWEPTGRAFAGADYITVPDHAAFDITTNLTAMVWAQITDISLQDTYLLSKYATVGNNREWSIGSNQTTGKLYFDFGDPADGTWEATVTTTAAAMVNATWALVGFTFAANTVVVYFDGSVVASGGAGVPATLWNDVEPINLGSAAGGGNFLTGKMGETWVYSRTLTAGEMLHNYNKTKWRYA